jgi:hypothetical protein
VITIAANLSAQPSMTSLDVAMAQSRYALCDGLCDHRGLCGKTAMYPLCFKKIPLMLTGVDAEDWWPPGFQSSDLRLNTAFERGISVPERHTTTWIDGDGFSAIFETRRARSATKRAQSIATESGISVPERHTTT